MTVSTCKRQVYKASRVYFMQTDMALRLDDERFFFFFISVTLFRKILPGKLQQFSRSPFLFMRYFNLSLHASQNSLTRSDFPDLSSGRIDVEVYINLSYSSDEIEMLPSVWRERLATMITITII